MENSPLNPKILVRNDKKSLNMCYRHTDTQLGNITLKEHILRASTNYIFPPNFRNYINLK